MVVGESDSGKSSLANILFGLIPEEKIAVLTKEKVFGSSMIAEDTQLLFVDEWNADMMSSDLLKTLLQGGYFPQSIKHSSPKMQTMSAGVFITCNNLPTFGIEDDNVRRRLSIFTTKSLPSKSFDAPKWLRDNAFKCLVWVINFINSNKNLLDPEEQFYERDRKENANARLKVRITSEELEKMKEVTLDSESSDEGNNLSISIFHIDILCH